MKCACGCGHEVDLPNHIDLQGEDVWDIPVSNQVIMFFQCAMCLREKPEGVSPGEYSQLSVGLTRHGLQVWCRRHDANVIHIDFQNACHPASNKLDNHEGN